MFESSPNWLGDVPERCWLCFTPIVAVFYHGRTYRQATSDNTATRSSLQRSRFSNLAIMCPSCHAMHGVGIGPDTGAKYEKTRDTLFDPSGPAVGPAYWRKVDG